MNRLSREKQIEVVKCLVEGMSIRSTSRITDVARNTVSKLILEIGEACQNYHDEHVRNLSSKRVECDEIWSFVGKKDKELLPEEEDKFGVGSVWTWTAIDAESKLAVSWLVGARDAESANQFMLDVADRLSNRIQLSTDAHKPYLKAVAGAFGNDVDFAQLVKIYGNAPGANTRYSPAECTGIKKIKVTGSPAKEFVSTSYVERQNLTMRMSMRRFTRLTNAFSKNVQHHIASVALHFTYYNFVRIHQTLRCSPAMEAGLTSHLWDVGDLVDLLGTTKSMSGNSN